MSTRLFFYDDRYQQQLRQLRDYFVTAQPFPHVVIDDFLPGEVCERLLAEFPPTDAKEWKTFHNDRTEKLAAWGETHWGEYTRALFAHLSSAGCLGFLEGLTNIEKLMPDPYFEGGGLHLIQRGGFLKIHADFNKHSQLNLDRRLNLILYLNKDWREEYNGHLELWDKTMSRCVQRILPIFNRCVIFSTTDWAYHGHADRLACPAGMTRKSLAVYYYTVGRPVEEQAEKHGTLWQERPKVRTLGGTVSRLLRRSAAFVEAPGKSLRKLANRLS